MKNFVCKAALAGYAALWLLFLVWYWVGQPTDGAMLWALATFYVVLPLAALGVSTAWGRCGSRWKFAVPFTLAAGQVLLWILTIGLVELLSYGRMDVPALESVLFTLFPALAGLAFGLMRRAGKTEP